MTIPDSAPPGSSPSSSSFPEAKEEQVVQRKRPLPAWVIAIPLAFAAGLGGYYLGKPSAESGGAQAEQAGSTRSGSSAAGRTTGPATTGASTTTSTATGRLNGSGAVVAVTASTAKAGTLTTQRTAAGTVVPAKSTSVVTRSSGTVTEVPSAVGQTVRAGQVLVKLSNPDLNAAVDSARNVLQSAQAQLASQQATLRTSRVGLEAAVQSAQLSLKNAQQTYSAAQQLYAAGAMSRSDLNVQAVAVQNAQSSLASAQTNLAQNTNAQQSGVRDLQLSVDKARIALSQAEQQARAVVVLAPFAGQVSAVLVVSGQYLSSGAGVVTLVSSDRQLTFNVPPADAPSFVPGRELSFVVGQQRYPVKVVSNPGSATNGVVPINARFAGRAAPAAGTVGAVEYTSAVGTGTLIPTTALQADNDKVGVFTVQNSRAKLQNVAIIGQTGDTAVVSGLAAGSQIIATPPAGLVDGVRVDTTGAGKAGGSAVPARGPS